MPRKRVRTTERGKHFDRMDDAVRAVRCEGKSVREAAKMYEICHVSLFRFLRKLKQHENGTCEKPTTGYKPHTKIFSTEQEQKISEYLLEAAD